MNIARPPFCIDRAQPAEAAAEEIVHVFQALQNLPRKVSLIFRTLVDCLAIAPDAPYAQAGLRLADAIDHDAAHFDLPYHNKQHVCEVMLCSHYLARSVDLGPHETLEIILAALFHDFRHDGDSLNDAPFRLERNSINLARPYLLAAGVTEGQCRKLAALVLATHPQAGLPVAHAYYSHHHRAAPRPRIPANAPELAELDNPDNAKHALLLCQADILPSLGLTIDYALMLQEKLAQEWGMPLGIEDKVRFIDSTRHLFDICDAFMPNILRLRNHLLARQHAGETE